MAQSHSKLITVIVPVYNCADFLSDCVGSLQRQSFRDFEVVFVDDGSTDGSSETCDEAAKKLGTAKVLHKENEGLLLARRDGLGIAEGDYIVFLDADDAIRSDALELLAHKISLLDPDIVMFEYSRNADFRSTGSRRNMLPDGLYEGERLQDVRQAVCGGKLNNLCTKAFRRSLMLSDKTEYQGYKGLMHGEDLLQLLPLMDKAERVVKMSEILYYYRLNDSASTNAYKPSQTEDLTTVFRVLLEYSRKWAGCAECSSNAVATHAYWLLVNLTGASGLSLREKENEMERIGKLFDECGGGNASVADLRKDVAIAKRLIASNHFGLAFCVASLTRLASCIKQRIA